MPNSSGPMPSSGERCPINTKYKPRKTKITRLAHGVPLGGSLEFLDSGTLLHALKGRVTLNS